MQRTANSSRFAARALISLRFLMRCCGIALRSITWHVYAIVIGPAVIYFLATCYPGTQQVRNMRAACSHIQVLQPLFLRDVRFFKVKADAYTGGGGMLSIRGTLNSESDFPDLKKTVRASNPPVGVMYDLQCPGRDPIIWKEFK
ncbi:MAG: hypothetical protein ACKVY0_01350 [Prosthecobacter sp.]|uniref:hypothetical protein n=1 Tax=Prosthecobacter sp. TaxID=1965333 RepID=UPI003900012F